MKNMKKFIPVFLILALVCCITFASLGTSAEQAVSDEDVVIDMEGEGTSEETEQTLPDDGEFVLIRDYIPDIYVDLKYATDDNITGTAVYDFEDAYLRYGTVKKLEQVSNVLREEGYALKIWDAFRPTEAQFRLWEAMPDASYIANPYNGYSDHSRGNCIDLTLVDLEGNEVAMPTGFDNFSALADRDYSDVGAEAATNARLLEDAMIAAGFIPYSAEWWHFTDETDYPVETQFYPPADDAYETSMNSIENCILSSKYPIEAEICSAETAKTDETEEPRQISVSAIGDCVLATGYGFSFNFSFEDYMGEEDQDYFFSQVQSVLQNDDLTIANSENVFTDETTRVNKDNQGDNAFWFKSSPEYANIYARGSVEAVNVANNHSHDYGEVGYLDSLDALEDAGVATFGYGNIAYDEIKGVTVAMIGINTLGPLEEGRTTTEIKTELTETMTEAKDNADVVIVSLHWGEEGSEEPNDLQRELGHMAVDLGADLVIGHHPHVLQEVEVYNGVPIAYSLGNFVFGGNSRPDRDTMILSVTFTVDASGSVDTDYEVIEAYVYGEGSRNNYQPVLA